MNQFSPTSASHLTNQLLFGSFVSFHLLVFPLIMGFARFVGGALAIKTKKHCMVVATSHSLHLVDTLAALATAIISGDFWTFFYM